MTRIRRGDDSGVYAILYALLLLALVGMAAIIVDLGSLRQNRRQTRLAADAAVIAGARELDTTAGSANPRQACIEALDYLSTNLDETFPPDECNALPTTVPACPASVTEPRPSSTVGGYTAVITWPVLDSSDLLTEPDVKPAGTGVTTQAIDPDVDGTDACARIGVSVQEVRDPAFAGIFGTGQTSTVVTSVARSTSKPGVGGPIAALNVLEQDDCQAIVTGGQAAIEILAVGTRPGIIAVESSGRETGGSCPNSKPWVIDVAFNSSGGHVWANGVDGIGKGTIMSYALNASPTGNPLQTYNPLTVAPAQLLLPTPTVMTERFGATPVTDIYDCKGTCLKDHTQYVTELENAIGGGNTVPNPYPNAAPPYNTQTFQTVSATTVPGWPGCTIGVGDAIIVPAGNWYVPCAPLRVQGTLVFAGGTVVTRGGINVSSGCFSMNVPLTTATCPTVSSGTLTTPGTSEGILYLRSGNFEKGSQASLFTEKTFVYMAGGAINFGGGSTGTLYLTNPRPDSGTCDDDCQAGRFGKVTLWNESSSEQRLGGATGVTLRGILFVPNAPFVYTGQGVQVQTNAQFWARTIEMSGQGTLRMAPDPTDSVERPEQSTVLIR